MYGPNLQLHQTHSRCCSAKRNPPISSNTGIPNACRCEWQLTQNTQKKDHHHNIWVPNWTHNACTLQQTHILKKWHHSGQCRSVRRSRLPLPWIHCSDTKIASKNSSNSARGRQCESKATHGAQKRAPESKHTSTEMQIPQKNRQNQNPRNTINKEINPNFGEKCFGSHLNNQLYVTGGCNWREMTSLS